MSEDCHCIKCDPEQQFHFWIEDSDGNKFKADSPEDLELVEDFYELCKEKLEEVED